jgi:hypothetical protein
MNAPLHIIPDTIGEKCRHCGLPATHKVSEVVKSPESAFVQYLCCLHFSILMGYEAAVACELTRRAVDASPGSEKQAL